MPIIINEFEIVPDPPSQNEPQQPTPAGREPEEVIPDPEDIVRVQRVYLERKRRLRAD